MGIGVVQKPLVQIKKNREWNVHVVFNGLENISNIHNIVGMGSYYRSLILKKTDYKNSSVSGDKQFLHRSPHLKRKFS